MRTQEVTMTPTPDGLDAGGAQGLARGRNRVRTLLLLAGGVVLGTACYWFRVRPWMAQWGTSQEERTRQMPGDRIIGHPTNSAMQAVTVEATPEDIWPWLVQIGYQRGGLYSYDWLDRIFGFLDRPSATRILPEFQQLAVGDEIPLGRGPRWPVAAVEASRALVLDMRNMGGIDWVWEFGLYPVDEKRTQLVSRSRVRAKTIWARLFTFAIEPAGFLM